MDDKPAAETMSVLRDFGFVPNNNPYFKESLVYHFRNFDLEAAPTLDKSFQDTVLFTGFYDSATNRVMYAPVEFYLPRHMFSSEQCGALIAYYLRHLPMQDAPIWLVRGRQQTDALPWTVEAAKRKAAYDASPKCFIHRDWLRSALRTLASKIKPLTDDTPIVFEFGQGILSIQCDEDRIVATAKGEDWPKPVCVRAEGLRKLPRRFSMEEVCVIVGGEHLNLGPMRCRIVDKIE